MVPLPTLDALDLVTIPAPCPVRGTRCTGDERTRFRDQCRQARPRLSELRAPNALSLLRYGRHAVPAAVAEAPGRAGAHRDFVATRRASGRGKCSTSARSGSRRCFALVFSPDAPTGRCVRWPITPRCRMSGAERTISTAPLRARRRRVRDRVLANVGGDKALRPTHLFGPPEITHCHSKGGTGAEPCPTLHPAGAAVEAPVAPPGVRAPAPPARPVVRPQAPPAFAAPHTQAVAQEVLPGTARTPPVGGVHRDDPLLHHPPDDAGDVRASSIPLCSRPSSATPTPDAISVCVERSDPRGSSRRRAASCPPICRPTSGPRARAARTPAAACSRGPSCRS
jgi:hypothetical protein